MSDRLHGVKRSKRKLTSFLAYEMLYDFVTGHLDPERKLAIEEFVKTDRESQNLVDAIKRGIAYSQVLKEIQLSETVMAELEQAENFVSLSKRLARWSSWPDSLRWSIIAVVISACTAGVMVLIPWQSVPIFAPRTSRDDNTVEIARIDAKSGNQESVNLAGLAPAELSNEDPASKVAEDKTATGDQSGDEEFAEESSGQVRVPPAGQAESLKTPPMNEPPSKLPASKAAPVAALVAPKTVVPKTVVPSPAQAPAAPAQAAAPAPTQAAVRGRGFVYRTSMTLPDLETAAPKITQQIKELGAEKAGEVELGWKRGSGRYYHFTLPEANEQKLLEALRAYGPVRISKDPHPRQMPVGEVRYILWIESGT